MTTTATVETLTAEVRVLMVGNRQITQSIYKQLDYAPFQDVRPFGRVRTNKPDEVRKPAHRNEREQIFSGNNGRYVYRDVVELVGSDRLGNLVRSHVMKLREWDISCPETCRFHLKSGCDDGHIKEWQRERLTIAQSLPLIVLAGLR